MCNMKEIKDYQIVVLGLIVALGAILSTFILTQGIVKYQRMQNQTITVTGSSSQNVTSDFAVLNFTYKTSSPNLKEGYKKMNADMKVIENFLVENGIDKKDIEFGSVSNYEVNKRYGSYTTNEIDFYRFNNDVKVSSKDINKITEISKQINSLVENDVEIVYSNVQYFVSNLDDIKIKMVGQATKNAKERANSMVEATGGKIGALNSAKMGVFQIVPVNSTDVSDMGISDTNSIEKKVVAVVNATFTVAK